MYIIEIVQPAFRDFPERYAGADPVRKAAIIREIVDAAVFNANGVAISWKWKKPFAFFMREEIVSINKVDVSESSKTSTSAGEMGLKLLDTSLLNVIIWCRKSLY